MSCNDADSDRVLRILLTQTEPEDRDRLRVAWERHAQGNPDSLPALYALADRFSLAAHAELLKRQEKLLEAFQEQWSGTPSPVSRRNSGRKPGGWITGALCCLAAGLIGAAVARQIPFPSSPADRKGEVMIKEISAGGGELLHYVNHRDGRVFQIIELRASAKPPEAYLTREHHGVIVFEDQRGAGTSPQK